MKKLGAFLMLSLALGLSVPTWAANKVDFANLRNNQEVKSPVLVKFSVEGKTIRNAGEAPMDETSGHHHLIIDGTPIPVKQPIPTDETHLHFGKGQTETTIKLTPGKHTLTLQFADGSHLSYGPEMSKSIEIIVKK